ncbi:MAG: hypothetical protein ACTHK4_07265 [Mycobacteriales bacterium]
MRSCPRCGTSLQDPAAICTACCQPLTDAGPDTTPGWIDLVALEADAFPEPEPQPQAPPPPSADHHPRLASAGVGNGLALTSNRAAGFNPVRVSTSPPPPNRFRAADQRQRARVQAAATEQGLPPAPSVQPTTKWVEPEPE